ncbi:histidine kinase [Pseudovibrio sp. POLY-S9]|uniref:histidine kinase n=1 Tax=Pseudovibrio sp. POLY-S9 TaxID=1576596 RepID=UPI00070F2796|nr:histidine kinase [Pseudovibrio sp. POLY-S9]
MSVPVTQTANQKLRDLIDAGVLEPDRLMAEMALADRQDPLQWRGSFQHRVINPIARLLGRNVGSIEGAKDRERWRKVKNFVHDNPGTTNWPGFDKFQHFIVGAEITALTQGLFGRQAGLAAGVAGEAYDQVKRYSNIFLDSISAGGHLKPHQVGFDPVDAEFTMQGAAFAQISSKMPEKGMGSFTGALDRFGVSTFFEQQTSQQNPTLAQNVFDSIADWFDYTERYASMELPTELLDQWEQNAAEMKRRHGQATLGINISGESAIDANSVTFSNEQVEHWSLFDEGTQLEFDLTDLDWGHESDLANGKLGQTLGAELSAKLSRDEVFKIRNTAIQEQHSFFRGLSNIFDAFGMQSEATAKMFQAIELIGMIRSTTIALQFSQIGAMSAFAAYTSVLSAAASLFSSSKPDPVAKALEQIMKSLSEVYGEVRKIRREMHQRFDRLDDHLTDISIQLGLLQRQTAISATQQRRILRRVEEILRRDLRNILEGQRAIRRDIINLAEGSVLGEVDKLIIERQRDGADDYDANTYRERGPRNLLPWINRNGRIVSRFYLEQDRSTPTNAVSLAASTNYRGRDHWPDGRPLNPSFVSFFTLDATDTVTPTILAPEVFQMCALSYRNLVLLFPEFHYPLPGAASSAVNTEADLIELIGNGREIIRYRTAIFDLRYNLGQAEVDVDYAIALFDILLRISNEIRSEITRLHMHIVTERSGEMNGFDPFLLGPVSEIALPGKPADNSSRDATLALYGATAPLEPLRDAIRGVAGSGKTEYKQAFSSVQHHFEAPDRQTKVDTVRNAAQLPVLQLQRLHQRLSEFQAMPTGYDGPRPQYIQIPIAWFERLPTTYVLMLLSGQLTLQAEYDPSQLKEHWYEPDFPVQWGNVKYHARIERNSWTPPNGPVSRAWNGEYMRNGRSINSRWAKQELSGTIAIKLVLTNLEGATVLSSALSFALARQEFKIEADYLSGTINHHYDRDVPRLAGLFAEKVTKHLENTSIEDFRQMIEATPDSINHDSAYQSKRNALISDLAEEIINSPEIEDLLDEADSIFHMIDDGLLPFIDPMDPDGASLIQTYLEARGRFTKKGLRNTLLSLNASIKNGEGPVDDMYKDVFQYGLGGGAMDEVGAAAWQAIAAPLAALSSVRGEGTSVEVYNDETFETIQMLEELRQLNKAMIARANIQS